MFQLPTALFSDGARRDRQVGPVVDDVGAEVQGVVRLHVHRLAYDPPIARCFDFDPHRCAGFQAWKQEPALVGLHRDSVGGKGGGEAAPAGGLRDFQIGLA